MKSFFNVLIQTWGNFPVGLLQGTNLNLLVLKSIDAKLPRHSLVFN